MNVDCSPAVYTRMLSVAQSIDVQLDTTRCSVARDQLSGVYSIVAACASAPENEAHRSIMASALHSAILDECQDLPSSRLNVQVSVPPSTPSRVPDATSPPMAADWIREQTKTYHTFVRSYSMHMLHGSFSRVVDSYPWRDRLAMHSRKDATCASVVDVCNVLNIQTVVSAAIDSILPSILGILSDKDCGIVAQEVSIWLQRKPSSVLEIYEAVHHMVVSHGRIDVTPQIVTLYDSLFLY